MQQVFVELYNYRPAWAALPPAERQAFGLGVLQAMPLIAEMGVEVIGYGSNGPDTPHRAPYDFFSVYRVPNAEVLTQFQHLIEESGWYDYFEQVNVAGSALSPFGGLIRNIALAPAEPPGAAISPHMPYRKKTLSVAGKTISYLDEGVGHPVVMVHGDVMSSFLWRNVIPHVSDVARAVAIDLIGAGDSEKLADSRPGRYTFATHVEFFTGFMEALGLSDKVVLVGHDWGANVAFEWARHHPQAVAGIAFADPILPPFGWEDWQPLKVQEFQYLRSDEGERDVLDNNFFVRQAPQSITRMLTSDEHAEIVRPYAEPGEARRPTIDWPREVPFADDRTETRTAVEAQRDWLATSSVPKLHLAGEPGGIVYTGSRRRQSIQDWPATTHAPLFGVHWTPEDNPHAIGKALRTWWATLEL